MMAQRRSLRCSRRIPLLLNLNFILYKKHKFQVCSCFLFVFLLFYLVTFIRNNIRVEGGKIIAESLKENKTLTHLNLERFDNNAFIKVVFSWLLLLGDDIGETSGEAILEALKTNTTLTYLNVGRKPTKLPLFSPPFPAQKNISTIFNSPLSLMHS